MSILSSGLVLFVSINLVGLYAVIMLLTNCLFGIFCFGYSNTDLSRSNFRHRFLISQLDLLPKLC